MRESKNGTIGSSKKGKKKLKKAGMSSIGGDSEYSKREMLQP